MTRIAQVLDGRPQKSASPGPWLLALVALLMPLFFFSIFVYMAPNIFSLGGAVPMEAGEAVGAVVLAIVLRPLWKSGGVAGRCVLGVLAVVFIFLALSWREDPRVQFCRALSHVRVGMTRGEARQAMIAYDDRLSESPGHMGYSHSDEGEFNGDFGSIKLRDNRVASVSFSPD